MLLEYEEQLHASKYEIHLTVICAEIGNMNAIYVVLGHYVQRCEVECAVK